MRHSPSPTLPKAHRVPPWEWCHGGKQSAQAAPTERTAAACSPKRYCRDMVSCDEARHYLSACEPTRLDGDSDGVPCEALFPWDRCGALVGHSPVKNGSYPQPNTMNQRA